jgi:hypothetical protein
MAKAKKREGKAGVWYAQLDPDEIQSAMEDATVDSNGEDEQLSGLFYAMAEEIEFPWQGSLLGEAVTVVDIEMPDNDRLGIDFVVERNGKQSRIEARSVEMLEPFPDGHLYFAAYLLWKQML